MKTFSEQPGELPVIAEPDVLVVGAGPAGIGAAIAAARNGAKTLLLERSGVLGGNLTNAMVNPLFTYHDRQGRQVIQGIAGEVVDRLCELGLCKGHVTDLTFDNASMTPFDPEGMKLVLARMVREAGCQIRLHSLMVDVVRQESRIKAVVIESKSGREAILPKAVIDASGDGDVAARSGCPYLLGEAENHYMQPVSLCFRIGGVNDQAMRRWMKGNRHLLKGSPNEEEIDAQEEIAFLGLNQQVGEAMLNGTYPAQAAARILFYQLPHADQVMVNATRLQGIDGTNAEDLTRAELETREQAWAIHCYLKINVGGFENSYILDTGSSVGVRETRHIIGDYELTHEDVLNATSFEDGIACGTFAVDIHPPKGKEQVFTGGGRVVYEIPYRSLLPIEMDNLWVAGRCISASHIASGSTRVMATCIAIGQGAGTAAAQAIENGGTSRQVDIARLRKQLIEQGQFLLNANISAPIDERLIFQRDEGNGCRASHYNPFATKKVIPHG